MMAHTLFMSPPPPLAQGGSRWQIRGLARYSFCHRSRDKSYHQLTCHEHENTVFLRKQALEGVFRMLRVSTLPQIQALDRQPDGRSSFVSWNSRRGHWIVKILILFIYSLILLSVQFILSFIVSINLIKNNVIICQINDNINYNGHGFNRE